MKTRTRWTALAVFAVAATVAVLLVAHVLASLAVIEHNSGCRDEYDTAGVRTGFSCPAGTADRARKSTS